MVMERSWKGHGRSWKVIECRGEIYLQTLCMYSCVTSWPFSLVKARKPLPSFFTGLQVVESHGKVDGMSM